jgi:hypothetical protein
LELLAGQLEGEIGRKPLTVPLYCLQQHPGLDHVDLREILIEHHPLATHEEDCFFNAFGRERARA